MEVIYTGLRQTPEMIAEAAAAGGRGRGRPLHPVRRPHDAPAARSWSWSAAEGMDDVLVAVGGIIPDADVAEAEGAGVAEVFGPGTTIGQVATLLPGARPPAWLSGRDGCGTRRPATGARWRAC